jgi:hypothetical protein
VDWFNFVVEKTRPFGLNLVAALPSQRYDAVASSAYRASAISRECRSIVLIGNGGPNFWHAFKAYVAKNSGWLKRRHPLDDFTREVIEREVVEPIRRHGRVCDVVYPSGNGPTLNFMQLATLAGLASPSIIGVVVNPAFGPWIAFRAALLMDCHIDHPGDAIGFDPCPTCATRACIASCPASAVSFPSGWDIPRCVDHRIKSYPDCASGCHSRTACVLSPDQRYPDDELVYHQARALESMRLYQKARIRTRH